MYRYLVILLLVSCTIQQINRFQILQVSRELTISKQLINVRSDLVVKSLQQNSHFIIVLPIQLNTNLTNIKVSLDGKLKQVTKLKPKDNNQFYEIDVDLDNNQEVNIVITEEYFSRFNNLPRNIGIQDSQYLLLRDNVCYYSIYPVIKQKSTYQIQNIISQTLHTNDPNIKQNKKSKDVYIVEIDQEMSMQSVQEVVLHFEHNHHLAVFDNVEVVIEISHWGNIAMRGHYKTINEGAGLKGEYSRIDYKPQYYVSGRNALKKLQAKIPYHSNGLYIRDEIGNVSTSHAIRDHHNKQAHMTLIPRFSLFGGWRSNFEFGYNLPLHHYLFKSGNTYLFKQVFGIPFIDMITKNYTMKVILPEGAINIKTQTDLQIDNLSRQDTFSYLDIEGRPTIVMNKQKVSQHDQQLFTIQYEFEQISILREPVMIFCFYFGLFTTFISLGRLNINTLKIHD